MATKYYDADDFYMLKSEANTLNLSVQIGDKLNGGYLIFNGNELVGTNSGVMISKEQYIDTWITIPIIIKTRQGIDDWASVTVTLQEDSQIPKTFGPYRRRTAAGDDAVCYMIKIKIRK